MKKYYICVSKYFEDVVEAETEDEAVDKVFELFQKEQAEVFVIEEEEE